MDGTWYRIVTVRRDGSVGHSNLVGDSKARMIYADEIGKNDVAIAVLLRTTLSEGRSEWEVQSSYTPALAA